MINHNFSSAGSTGSASSTGSSLVESALIPQDAIYRDAIFNVKNYPAFVASAPFCCWKQGKIPYNPVTGKKARVDDVKTFGSLDDAYRGYMANRSYKGIGLKVSGKLGAIDLDKCVINDDVARDFKPLTLNSLSENAQKVLKLFPNAVVELSPSRTGLHLFFIVPSKTGEATNKAEAEAGKNSSTDKYSSTAEAAVAESAESADFTFDRDDYYINNRKLGMEIYFADSSNRFLTVTGNIINTQELRLCLNIMA